MKLNGFLWNIYKESRPGKDLIAFFENYNSQLILCRNIEFYSKLRHSIAYSGTLDLDFEEHVTEISELYYGLLHDENNQLLTIEMQSMEDAKLFFDDIYNLQFLDDKGNLNDNDCLSSDDIPVLSEVLYAISPKYFFPYYFVRLYQDVIEIFSSFGIFLPSVPRKNDNEGRFFHYFELCKSLYDFRIANELNEYELPSFIYGFAIYVIKRYKVADKLPEPRRAYFVGGGKKDSTVDSSGDFNYLDNANAESICNWNGDPDTQIGDIVVMYCLSPRSYIHSIWRAVTPGSLDPFFHYYKNINIGKPILVKPISLKEIKNDPALSELPLVKANMQGINGRNIPKKYYDYLLDLLKNNGQDIRLLPKLTESIIAAPYLQNERDVEEVLLEPLLVKIGYNKKDWLRQMKLRMGRGDRVYPDYAIFPKEERNNESCYWLWEAKYTITSHRQLEEDFGQAKSYALRLKSSGLGLVSKEGIWLSRPDYDISKIRFWSWKQIAEHEILNEIFDIAGNKNKL